MAEHHVATTDHPLRTLEEALDRVAGTSWIGLDDTVLLDALAALPRLKNRFDALTGEIAVAAEQGAVQRAGSRKASIWIGANTNASPAQIRHGVTTAKWLLDFARFRDAHERGVLSRRHIDRLRAADRVPTHLAMVDDQDMLLGFAAELSLSDFERALQYWINAVDPDGTIPDDQIRRNKVVLKRHGDGSVDLHASLDPLLGTAVYNAIEAETQKVRRDDGDDIVRPQSHRSAQALVDLVSRGAQRSDGSGSPPLINVVMGERLAEQLLLAEADPRAEISPRVDDPNFRCEFIDGTPLHPRLAKALLGVAELRRIVLDAASRPIDVSVAARSFPQWMRDAALVSSRGRCREHGCDARFHWLHADHRRPHAKGGQTRLENLDPLCESANLAKSDSWDPNHDKPAA
ncbi:MAG: HNH endonuclease signature motif containing protein [Actinomycetota bacterium]